MPTGTVATLGGGLVLNRVLSPGTPVGSQVFSEVLGATGCALLIWQVLAEATCC